MLKKIFVGFFVFTSLSAILFIINFGFVKPISKDTWIVRFQSHASSRICQQLFLRKKSHEIMDKHYISEKDCNNYMPTNVEKCIFDFNSKLPNRFSKFDDMVWESKIGGCAAGNFFDVYLSN